jgi:hypothetical protein
LSAKRAGKSRCHRTSVSRDRDAKAVLNIAAAWDSSAADEANIEWARTAWRDLRQFSTGGTYVNF